MPYRKVRNPDGSYRVVSPHGTKAKHTTKKNAEEQIRLLNAKEHGWTPKKKR